MSDTTPVLVPEGTYVGQVIDLELKRSNRVYIRVIIQSPTAPGLIHLYRFGMVAPEWAFIKSTGANVKVQVRHKTTFNGTIVCDNLLLSIEPRKD